MRPLQGYVLGQHSLTSVTCAQARLSSLAPCTAVESPATYFLEQLPCRRVMRCACLHADTLPGDVRGANHPEEGAR